MKPPRPRLSPDPLVAVQVYTRMALRDTREVHYYALGGTCYVSRKLYDQLKAECPPTENVSNFVRLTGMPVEIDPRLPKFYHENRKQRRRRKWGKIKQDRQEAAERKRITGLADELKWRLSGSPVITRDYRFTPMSPTT